MLPLSGFLARTVRAAGNRGEGLDLGPDLKFERSCMVGAEEKSAQRICKLYIYIYMYIRIFLYLHLCCLLLLTCLLPNLFWNQY